MTIVCVGQSAYDITYFLHEDIKENQKYRVYETQECIGAPATNAACLCAKWGQDVKLISRIGKDRYGELILEELVKQGVDTQYVMACDDIKTPVSTIITHVENGSRTIFNCPSKSKEVAFRYPKTCDVVLLDGHEEEASIELLHRFPNAISMLDAGTCREETKRLAPLVDHLVCSQDFAFQYTGICIDVKDPKSIVHTFRKLRELNQKQIVVTLGEQGLLYLVEDTIVYHHAQNVVAVDTTGAGDIFHGAYAYGLAKQWSLEKIIDIATRAAGISVTRVCGNLSIPSLQDIAMQLEMEKLKEVEASGIK